MRRQPGEQGWFAPHRRARPGLVDVVPAVAIAAVQLWGTYLYSQDEPSLWDFDAWAYLALAAGPVALLVRRRWPAETLLVAAVAAAAYAASGYPRGPEGLPAFAFALLSAILLGRRRLAWSVLALAYPAFIWLPLLNADEEERLISLAGAAVALSWLPLLAAGGEIARIQRERRAEWAHASQEQARLRIVQELHDVLAHNISLINVQSGVALHLLDDRPEQARPALRAINEASEEALGELRSVLDLLASGERAPRAPTAGRRDLDGLVRRTRAAGFDVTLRVEGEARPVPAGVDLAAFRIVQEALTNMMRHAGEAATAVVRVAYAPAELVVQVDDDGCGNSELTAGRGIAGMRERVHALGGTFAAGPRPEGGFQVRARFPLPAGAR